MTTSPLGGIARRDVLLAAGALCLTSPSLPVGAMLGTEENLKATWVATDSFSEDSGKAGFIAFDEAAYKAMASDR
eukprot:CAMPEP_0185165870 /NCGR_PEP_ID=MMETSP1139-20130426/11587_1 /TAXON_ID=298111 /ORGANISM="Pavlova sp., Strain CCMP459" /LENGTH=74 /DNA_ID=CAMNT_0027731291 /DNA_START=52 /DNA_END=273 /DNA_ORIENTATION=+